MSRRSALSAHGGAAEWIVAPPRRTWVCVTLLDERDDVAGFLDALDSALGGAEVNVVVADAREDGAAVDGERVHVLHEPGATSARALEAAFAYALEQGAEVVVQMDAAAHDPDELPRLLAGLRSADVVVGSRHVAGSAVHGGRLARRFGAAGAWYARRALGVAVRDPGSGFRCFRRSALLALVREPLDAGDYGVATELTRRAVHAGQRIAELPISVRGPGRRPGASRIAPGRIVPFVAVGLVGAATGYAALVAMVELLGWSPHLAFLLSSLVSFETNFLLNDRFTWSDREHGTTRMRRRLRFHAGRWLVYPPSQLVFSLLVLAGVAYIGASVAVVVLASAVNYVVGDRWVFGRRRAAPRPVAIAPPPPAPEPHVALPLVSVVIPVRESAATLERTVRSVLAQDYDGPIEVVIVGSPNDGSWNAVREQIAAGTVTAYEIEVDAAGRDTTAKRTLGFDHAAGSILCSIDSDTLMPPHWIAEAVSAVRAGWDGVAGPCASLDDSFWGDYVDRNQFGSKTPRMASPYVFDAATLGRRGHKPPVTGCAVFTAEVYAAVGGFDKDFVYHYDDYEFFQRVAEHGFRILCTPELTIGVHHRDRFGALAKEYWESGAGCAQFVRKFRGSKLSIARLEQLALVLGGCVAAALFPLYAACAIVVGTVVLGAAGVWRERRWQAAVYPPITLALGLAFAAGMAFRLVASAVHRPETRVGGHTRRDATGAVLCGDTCEKVVRMPGAGDDLVADLASAATPS